MAMTPAYAAALFMLVAGAAIEWRRTTAWAAAALAASLSVVQADTWDKKTTVSFSQPVEVPGAILQPGNP